MPDPPFQHELAEQRRIVLPPGLPAERREKLVSSILAAVRRQAELSARCRHILAVEATVREMDDAVVVSHERAAGLFTADLLDAPRPDLATLSWVCWTGLSALAAAEAADEGQRRPHATICAEAFYQDEHGCLKLGDFGLVSAFEAAAGGEPRAFGFAGGPDARRLLRCSPFQGFSGEWRLTPETETHACGWLATSRALELLDPRAACSSAADQFALAALLFLWATGRHPYYDDLSDPTVSSCFLDEPYALSEERPDLESGAAAAWAALVEQMLASQRTARFTSLAAALAAWQPYFPAAWPEAIEKIAAAQAALGKGDVQFFLQTVSPLAAQPKLPTAWRLRLDSQIERVEAQRDRIAQRIARLAQLQEAHSALDRSDLVTARGLAAEVLEAAQDDPEIAADASTLLVECEKLEKLFESAANRLAATYLEQASAALERRDFKEVAECLEAILRDPGTTEAWRDQALRLQAEAHELQRAIRAQLHQLQAAHQALNAAEGERARGLVRELLALPRLEQAVRDEAGRLQERIYALLAREAEVREALTQAVQLWEAGDLGGLENLLGSLPTEGVGASLLAEIQPWREKLTHLRGMETVLQRARESLSAERYEACLAQLDGLSATGPMGVGMPRSLALEAEQLRFQCLAALEELRRQALAEAQQRVSIAEQQLARGDWQAAQHELRLLSGAADLPDTLKRRVGELQGECGEQERIDLELDRIAAQLAADDPAADRTLARWESQELPERLAQRCAALRAEVAALLARLKAAEEARAAEQALRRREEEARRLEEERQRAAAERARVQKLHAEALAALKLAEAALAEGDVVAGNNALRNWTDSAELDQELRARYAHVRQALDALMAQLARLEKMERAAVAPTDPALPEQLVDFARQEGVPAYLAARAERAAKQARNQIRTAQQDLDAELKALEARLREHGRKARDLPARLRKLRTATLLTPEQSREAETIQTRYDQLPRPRPRLGLVGALAGGALLAGGAAALWLMWPARSQVPPPDPRPVPPPNSYVTPEPSPPPEPSPEPAPAPSPWPQDSEVVPPPPSPPTPVPPEPVPRTPAQPTIVELLALHPPRKPEWSWNELMRFSLPALADLFQPIPPGLDLGPVIIPADVALESPQHWIADESDGVARQTLDLPLWETRIGVVAEIRWNTAHQAWEWALVLTEDGRRTAAEQLVERVARAVADLGDDGELATAWGLAELAQPVFAALSEEPGLADIRLNLPVLPPRWMLPEGYEAAGEIDQRSGYPRILRDSAGRELMLVALNPRSEVWGLLAGQLNTTKGWRIFYFDTQPLTPADGVISSPDGAEGPAAHSKAVDTLADARDLAASVGRAIPSPDEWRLALTALGKSLLSDGYIWCEDAQTRSWAAGGALLTINGRTSLWPPLTHEDSPQGIVGWMRNPLTMQRRVHGDGLVLVRTILRIWPR